MYVDISNVEDALSVSTSGSKGVQLRLSYRLYLNNKIFQYPQADRRGCNHHVVVEVTESEIAFSIHKRIEGGATKDGQGFEISYQIFQYPQADRRGCNPRTKCPRLWN